MAVIVVPRFDPRVYADRGAVGLLVPGAGSTVSRERALASLVSGRVVSSLVDLDRKPSLELATAPAETTIYVALPPPGSSQNVVRYPVAIVGPAYNGLLTSGSTRIDGLVSLADIAPTAAAIAAGAAPRIQARVEPQAAATLARLDIDLTRAHDARKGATIVLVAWIVVLAALGILHGSAVAGRAAVLVAPAAFATALLLRAVGVDDPTTVVVALGLSTGTVAFLLGLRAGALVPAVVAFLSLFLLTLAVWPEINALAAIGPHPDGGGRFFGMTNQVGTLLLAPSLAAATLVGVVGAVAIGLLLLVTVGWSRAGADGGGVLVTATALAVLLAGTTRARLTAARVVLGVLGIVVFGLALVGLDALLGGSSHVTNAVGGGPGSLFDDLDRRLRISWAGATSAWHTVLLCLLALAGLGWLGWRGRRSPVVVAMLAGLGVSLIVNDTPVDVLGYGALGLLALTAWDETRALERSSEASHRNRASHESAVGSSIRPSA
ncbi:hypothetical protein [Gaiella sp.]|uniref:hypothetical protein n=1 Tax=Gaiella sp. TaxID=2663207 RepID=UPI003265C2B2